MDYAHDGAPVGTASESVTLRPQMPPITRRAGIGERDGERGNAVGYGVAGGGRITYGQTLASSTLTGGTASTAGTFAWTTPRRAALGR